MISDLCAGLVGGLDVVPDQLGAHQGVTAAILAAHGVAGYALLTAWHRSCYRRMKPTQLATLLWVGLFVPWVALASLVMMPPRGFMATVS